MIKKILALLPLFLILFLPKSVFAFKPDTYVTISNPVRGYEGWSNKSQQPLDLPIYQYLESTASGLPITWLLRYDAVSNATMSAFFEKLTGTNKNQTLGAFLEITPLLTYNTGVTYPDGISIFNANRIFLSGYIQEDRIRLIDTYMDTFFTRFGYYPKSVAAWHIDSFSLQYLQSKYSVLTAMNCDDQYATDSYRIWGGYLGSPYYPDKNNSLIPASSLKNRISLAMVRWAQRDLFNFYGPSSSSLYSVQINDYQKLGKNTIYFENILKLYAQENFNELAYLNIGLENDDILATRGKEISSVYKSLITNQERYNLRFVSLSEFGDEFKSRYPESSPTYFYRTTDPAGEGEGEVFWYQSAGYRIGLKSIEGKTKIIDFRVYNREIFEEYYSNPNQNTSLYTEIPAVIDSIKYPGTELELDIDLTQFESTYDRQWDLWQMTLESGNKKVIFYPDSISFTNIKVPELKSKDVLVTNKKAVISWKTTPQTPLKDTYKYSWIFWIVGAIVIFKIIKKIKKGKPKIPQYIVIGLVFAFLAGLTVFRNSLNFPFGMAFFGPNGHDAIFHLSLIEKFAQNPFSFAHPQYSGVRLTNYHFIFDYFSGILSRIFNIPATTLYFRILPVIFAIILVSLINKLMTKWQYSVFEKSIGFILVFFAGSFGFIPKLLTGQDIFSGESAFWSNQSASLFLNPPFVLSLIFILLFLVNLPESGRIKPLRFIKLVILGALLAQTKVYAFVLLALALLISRRFSLMITIGLLGGLISLPFSSFSGSPFVFDPLWFPRSLFASHDRFYWPRFVQAWQSYEASGSFLKLLAVNIFATLTFLVGNLGLRILGLLGMTKTKTINLSQKIVFGIIIVGLVLPLVIVQKVNPWNTIQFMYYSLFFLSLLTAKVISQIFSSIKNIFLKALFLFVILVLATATSVGTIKDYLGNSSPARVSYTEMEALQMLKQSPRGIVLSPLFKKSDWLIGARPLYGYVSTAYISALSGQPEFMSDTINLDITGFDYRERSREVQRFYITKDKIWAKSFLEKNNIKYIYETSITKMAISSGDIQLTKIFDSGEVTIYKTN